MIRSSSYLAQSRHKIYYFRAVVPKGYPNGYSGLEFRRSLKTRNTRKAIRLARALRGLFEQSLQDIREGRMSWQEFKIFLDQQLNQLLTIEEQHILSHGPRPSSMLKLWKTHQIANYRRDAELIAQTHPAPEIPEYVHCIAKDLLKQSGFTLDNTSEPYRLFCEAALLMHAEAFQRRIGLSQDARAFPLSKSTQHANLHAVPYNTAPITNEPTSPLLSTVTKEFCKEMKRGGNWTEKTAEEYEKSYELLVEALGDTPIGSINAQRARDYKGILSKLPSNRSKRKPYRDLCVQDLINIKIPKAHLLSNPRINTYITQASSLYKWAMDNGYVASNPFSGKQIKDKTAAHTKRQAFNADDLKRLFSAPEFVTNKRKHPHYYWLPLIALYSGARIEEICQLSLADIRQEGSTWVFDINDSDERKLKNESSRRLIPIHSKLVELGLLEYMQQLKAKKMIRLFPELKHQRDGYSQASSKWFGRFRKRHGVAHRQKSFHSFRHTFTDTLKQLCVSKEQMAALLGHKDESITTGLYGKEYKPEVLKPIIELLAFDISPVPFKK